VNDLFRPKVNFESMQGKQTWMLIFVQGKHQDLIDDRKQGSFNKTRDVAIQITDNVGVLICDY